MPQHNNKARTTPGQAFNCGLGDMRQQANGNGSSPLRPSRYVPAPMPQQDLENFPDNSETLETTTAIEEALGRLVQNGGSIVDHTGVRQEDQEEFDAEQKARKIMKPMEIIQYDAWKAGAYISPIDWARDRLPVPGGKGTVKRYGRSAEAMNEIWNTDQATPENVSWVAQTHVHMLPLIKAVTMVANVQRDLVSRYGDGLTAREMAEIESIRRAKRGATKRLKATSAALNMSRSRMDALESAVRRSSEHQRLRTPYARPSAVPASVTRSAIRARTSAAASRAEMEHFEESHQVQ